ncbi:protein transporter [Coprinopsis cinerea okayama7|uniref:Protein transporter n=1 Tax=Coprinopsis cinerea (strain Okayama-7 / 130 / ATCC MYA-4618 / FGSC 9003) TaxID=240176 RepID=A8N916_COPC7|nr:protein transporter [Coprinopsis cinerea okayama7\|eukprot:XP_001831344.2 protein transporter [Coprinopsis cinerea okayama7\
MDGFDDLLAPTRQALETNPFAEGFHRSGSPDPWASPFTSNNANDGFGTSSIYDDHNPFSSSVNPYASPTTPAFGSPKAEEKDLSPEPEDGEQPTPANEPSDPLDSANATLDDDEDNRPLGTLRSPGFRESVAPISSAYPEPAHSYTSTPTRSRTPDTDVDSKLPTKITVAPPSAIQAQHIQQSTEAASSSRIVSPLEETTTSALERSLGGLALGPDVLGSGSNSRGWQQDDTSAWGRTDLPPTPVTPVQNPPPDDDSDDDKPINQVLKRHSQDESHNTPQTTDNGIPPVFVITVDDPQKVGDPLRPYIMYTVHTRTTSPLFHKSAFSVLRRYSDFVWLYEALCYNNPGVVVPPVPEKSSFGRFEDQFVRQRRLGLEKCIQKMANHPVLAKDPDLRLFLESDTFSLDIKHRKSETPHENKGLIASIGQTLAGPRFHETDEWFEKKKSYLDSLESQLRGLAKSIEFVARHRTELALATGEFATAVSDLSSSDVGKQLSHALAELAELERKAQDLQNTQSEQDQSTLMATVDEVRIYHAWKNAESDLLRTKQTHEKNRAQGKIPSERLGYSLSQIAEAERRASEAKKEYEHVSTLVKSEVARFEQERIEDFKDTLHAFLEGMISRQKELIASWENYQQLLLKRVGGGGPGSTRTSQDL